jgi:hypothetical protein
LKRRIAAGQIDQRDAITAERACLALLRLFESGEAGVGEVVDALIEYEQLLGTKHDHRAEYTKTLTSAPWRDCHCGICNDVGIDVMIFRGSERNKRRGFHNLAVFRERLNQHLASPAPEGTKQ